MTSKRQWTASEHRDLGPCSAHNQEEQYYAKAINWNVSWTSTCVVQTVVSVHMKDTNAPLCKVFFTYSTWTPHYSTVHLCSYLQNQWGPGFGIVFRFLNCIIVGLCLHWVEPEVLQRCVLSIRGRSNKRIWLNVTVDTEHRLPEFYYVFGLLFLLQFLVSSSEHSSRYCL